MHLQLLIVQKYEMINKKSMISEQQQTCMQYMYLKKKVPHNNIYSLRKLHFWYDRRSEFREKC